MRDLNNQYNTGTKHSQSESHITSLVLQKPCNTPVSIDLALSFISPKNPVGLGEGEAVMEEPGSVEFPGLIVPIAESPVKYQAMSEEA